MPLEIVFFGIKNRDEQLNPGAPCNAKQYLCKLKNWGTKKKKINK